MENCALVQNTELTTMHPKYLLPLVLGAAAQPTAIKVSDDPCAMLDAVMGAAKKLEKVVADDLKQNGGNLSPQGQGKWELLSQYLVYLDHESHFYICPDSAQPPDESFKDGSATSDASSFGPSAVSKEGATYTISLASSDRAGGAAGEDAHKEL